ncbi:MAG: diaminopimelate decarboxylase [Clostridia bacterium]|nr:diaminopimelate decarboxylase [Clostridia bacterium]
MLYPNQTIKDNCLHIGGVNTVDLAKKYGTPLYVMDEDMIRDTCREFKRAIYDGVGENGLVLYASKAFSCRAMYRLVNEEGLGVDVVSGGELYTAMKENFPPEKIYFHGNNKTADEIELALSYGVGRFAVDNKEELFLLNELAKKRGVRAKISFRIKPGIDAHTFDAVMTGQIDSKFGVALENGEAFEIMKTASGLSGIEVVGVHCHIGSQIFMTEPFFGAADVMIDFIARLRRELSIDIRELNLGGGYGIKYTEEDKPISPSEMFSKVLSHIKKKCESMGEPVPRILIEPGRSIVAAAGVTLYTVGSVKTIKDVRTYVAVDGGMTDNPRYALYESRYSATVANRAGEEPSEIITLAGRCCESGDLIGKDMPLQKTQAGDIIAVFSTGAYNYSMASNYNRVPRAATVFVSGGQSREVIRRESYEDLIRNDL